MELANLIKSLRSLGNDTATSNYISSETPKGSTDGINTKFRLQYHNLIVNSVYISYGTTFRTQSGFSVDWANSLITFSSPPANQTELLTDYNFMWFIDDDYTEFLNQSCQHISETDPTSVPSGLIMALLQYALGYFWQRRATQYAHRYSSSAAGVSQQVDTVTKNFMELSKGAFATGEKFRLQYYERQGQRAAPSSATVSYGIDPYTPRR